MGPQSATLTHEAAKRAKHRPRANSLGAPDFAEQGLIRRREFALPGQAGALASIAGIPIFASSEGSPTSPFANASFGLPIQRKLAIGAVNDPLEAEADRMANHVLSMPGQALPSLSSAPQTVHRKCSCQGGSGQCKECEEDEGRAKKLQRKEQSSISPIEAPPIVHEVLRSPGQPLDAATRAYVEPRFGHDFSSVRVHTDGGAAESAQAVNALAYASGARIVFGTGRYAPQTSAGMRLLVHELAHVVQQRSPAPLAGGMIAPGNSHKHQAGSGAAGSLLQRQAPGTAAPQPFVYKTDVTHLGPLTPGSTLNDVNKALDDEKKKGKITSFAVRGKANSQEQIFLLNVILQGSENLPWGTQVNLVTVIGSPKKHGDPDPQGLVTLRIDTKGAATVELIREGPLPGITKQTSKDDLIAAYKFAAVRSEKAPEWDPAELNIVAAALDLLPPDDKGALEGVELVRVDKIQSHPDRAGEFESPSGVAQSAAAAATQKTILRLADKAFPKDDLRFFGRQNPVPGSFQVILHEVGHAVETEIYRSKWKAHAQALADVKAAGEDKESDKQKRKELEKKIENEKKDSTKKRLQQELNQLETQLAIKSADAADKKTEETKLTEKRADVENLDKSPTSARLQKFIDLVNAKKISPFTTYAQKDLSNPGEFYAEAYSLWRVDSEFLKTNYPDVFNFFENDYRK